MNRSFGYGRHSTAKQSATEAVQREAVEQHWRTTLAPKGVEYAGWRYDAATSGGTQFSERPEGLNIWVLAQPGDYIVVSKLDRAFRSLIDGARTLEALAAKGVHFVALDLGIDTSTPLGEFAVHVLLAAAQMQRRYASERTREVMLFKAEQGQPIGRAASSRPYGWRWSGRGRNSRLVPDPEDRRRVDVLHDWRVEGLSLHRIAARAMRADWQWLAEGGRCWYPASVAAALRARAKGYPPVFMRSRRGKASA